MRSMVTPSRSHQTASLLKLNQTIGRGKGYAVVGTNGLGQAAFLKQALKGGQSSLFLDRLHGLTKQKITAGMVGSGQGVTIPLVPQHELALVVGAPQSIWECFLGIEGTKSENRRTSFAYPRREPRARADCANANQS